MLALRFSRRWTWWCCPYGLGHRMDLQVDTSLSEKHIALSSAPPKHRYLPTSPHGVTTQKNDDARSGVTQQVRSDTNRVLVLVLGRVIHTRGTTQMQSGFVLLLRRWCQEMYAESPTECLKYVSKPYVDVNKHISVYTFRNTLYNLTYTEFVFTMSLYCVQTGSGAHPASCTMGTGGSFPRG